MKRLLTTILTSCILAAALVSVSTTGCATTQSTQKIIYKTLKSVQDASVAGLRIYGNAYAEGKITPEKKAQVDNLYKKYQAIFQTALDAAKLNYQAPVPQELTLAIQDLLNLINILKL